MAKGGVVHELAGAIREPPGGLLGGLSGGAWVAVWGAVWGTIWGGILGTIWGTIWGIILGGGRASVVAAFGRHHRCFMVPK